MNNYHMVMSTHFAAQPLGENQLRTWAGCPLSEHAIQGAGASLKRLTATGCLLASAKCQPRAPGAEWIRQTALSSSIRPSARPSTHPSIQEIFILSLLSMCQALARKTKDSNTAGCYKRVMIWKFWG